MLEELYINQLNIQDRGTIMTDDEKAREKSATESFSEIFKTFGDAISEIFNDPELKEKAREFTESAAESARAIGSRFKDEDVKTKFRDVGKAAQEFGKSIADNFKDSTK